MSAQGFTCIVIYPDGERLIWMMSESRIEAERTLRRIQEDQPAMLDIRWESFKPSTHAEMRSLADEITKKYPGRMPLNMKLDNPGRALSNDQTVMDRIKNSGRSMFQVDGVLGRPW